jgi:hypothetical protein
MARPRKNVDLVEIIGLRYAGFSWRDIARRTRLGKGTVVRYHRRALELLALSQNGKKLRCGRASGRGKSSLGRLRGKSRARNCTHETPGPMEPSDP